MERKPTYSPEVRNGKNGRSKARCLACGTEEMRGGRRYCSKECRKQINWVLSLSKGLLRTFNARYAAFSFTDEHVILDVLPVWSKGISRFILRRTPGRKPAEDLKDLILSSGEEWYSLLEGKNSRSYATLVLLEKNHTNEVNPSQIMPSRLTRLRLSKQHREYMKILKLTHEDLFPNGSSWAGDTQHQIKLAYKRMAKIHHPDKGGDAEKFKALNEAHQQMLIWAENPQFTCRKALEGCWSYDGAANKWVPPL
ncbi:MAG TPA: J domain-containing protein [Desulfobacterales bacterium]|nr:J domain-containing protein [Desulfobacterales bacterium]